MREWIGITQKIGHSPLTENQIIELRDKRANGTLIKDLMADYRLSKATIYRYLTKTEA